MTTARNADCAPWCTDHQKVSDIDYCMTDRVVGQHFISIIGPDLTDPATLPATPNDLGGVSFYKTTFSDPLADAALDEAVTDLMKTASDAVALAAELARAAGEWRATVRTLANTQVTA